MQKYIILDTETTGIEDDDKICQLCYALKDDKSFDIYDTYCKSDTPISFSAMAIHHITPEMIENSQYLENTKEYKLLQELNISDNVMVIHNAPFDLAFLAKEGFDLNMRLVDTLRCAKHLYKEAPSKSLQFLRYYLGLYKLENKQDDIAPHDAKGDVLVLKFLFEHMLKENSIERLIELTATPVLYEYFTFGKYKDSKIEEVVLSDMNYCSYLLSSNMNDPDLGYSLKHYIDKNKGVIVNKFPFGKYKDKRVSEISDIGYLKWAYENMNISDALKNDILDKINNN